MPSLWVLKDPVCTSWFQNYQFPYFWDNFFPPAIDKAVNAEWRLRLCFRVILSPNGLNPQQKWEILLDRDWALSDSWHDVIVGQTANCHPTGGCYDLPRQPHFTRLPSQATVHCHQLTTSYCSIGIPHCCNGRSRLTTPRTPWSCVKLDRVAKTLYSLGQFSPISMELAHNKLKSSWRRLCRPAYSSQFEPCWQNASSHQVEFPKWASHLGLGCKVDSEKVD